MSPTDAIGASATARLSDPDDCEMRPARRQLHIRSIVVTATMMIAAPLAITLKSRSRPGSGSMSRVAPNGVTMLDAQQPTAATAAATTAMLAACMVTARAIDRLDRPRARSAARSA